MIKYNSKNLFYKKPFGAVPVNTDIFFRIGVEDKPIDRAYLIMSLDNGKNIEIDGILENKIDLKNNTIENENYYYFHWKAEESGLYFYYFEVICKNNDRFKTDINQLTIYSENNYVDLEWMKEGLMYQIFPDRFARSKKYIPPKQNKPYILREDWGGTPIFSPNDQGVILNNDFFGGNIIGIIENLDYLKELGVTVIYLNPIFQSFSNHRYDTGNYMKIDPILGTLEDFKYLCSKASNLNIRIILDGVFNHTGSDSLYFNKYNRYSELGAFQSKESKYYEWYNFIEYPNKYESWWGIDTLPSVNQETESYLNYMLRDENSVVKYWLKCGISGFRLDVADELTDKFLDELRVTVKSINPNAVIVGEVWEDASNKISYGKRRRYFQGKQLDSVMNYPIKDAILDFILYSKDGRKMAYTVESLWENYPNYIFYSLMNILSTHDTERILTVFLKNSANYESARQKLFLALLLWAFLPGIPCIYYGDEIGMQGGRDPFCRGCFEPSKRDKDIYLYYKKLFAFKSNITKLSKLEFFPEYSSDNIYSFSRNGENQRLIILTNSGNEDFLLELELRKNEILRDFFICGSVKFDGKQNFIIGNNSGIVVYITK
ncbi:glycoside hydrolase family 13 protein [Anaerovorax odorimutans]|uniref:glycoside hydrolase family 13 protein n=1 Tax=Anaerovorax odorimutans TaxID=109327 RepID=UPI00042A55BC|nr:glycoside hydrolase family 13 protein [Anaerovorax odorimutans]